MKIKESSDETNHVSKPWFFRSESKIFRISRIFRKSRQRPQRPGPEHTCPLTGLGFWLGYLLWGNLRTLRSQFLLGTYITHDIQPVPLGRLTSWPKPAEAPLRVIKNYANHLFQDIEDDLRKGVTTQTVIREGCWARNVPCTYGGQTPIELVFGQRAPDAVTLENTTPGQLKTAQMK